MRRIIGIGETHYDIVFKNSQPYKGYPSGFAFNSVISLGRLGLRPILISEVGNDFVGEIIINTLKENGVETENMYRFYDARSALNVTSTDERDINHNIDKNQTSSYISYPSQRLDIVWPRIDPNDIVYFGSYFSLEASVRKYLIDIITYAIDRKSIIFYDVDFDKRHSKESVWLMPSIIENLEFADVVLGTIDDFANIYKDSDIDKVYRNHIKFYCTNFICINNAGDVILKSIKYNKEYNLTDTQKIISKSAKDAFYAGIIYAFYLYKIEKENLDLIDDNIWNKVIITGIGFVENVNNNKKQYITEKYATELSVSVK